MKEKLHIGLVDVDGKRTIPNLALCKIARYHKEKGDEVEWAWALKHYDVIYKSKVFNFTPDDGIAWNADVIIKGGTGYDIESRLPSEIDRLQPDYSIYANVHSNVAYGFLTRGCPNKCAWCVVPEKEGSVYPYMDIEDIAIEGRTNIVLFDNNILALKDYAVSQFKKIILKGYKIDFNQAMDARLVTSDIAPILAQIKWIHNRIRFGCDTPQQIKHCRAAIDLLDCAGYKGEYFIYTMLTDNIIECYERTNYWYEYNRERCQQHKSCILIHCQPYRDPHKLNRVPQWQKDMSRWSNRKEIYNLCSFADFQPRKGFKCSVYLQNSLTKK